MKQVIATALIAAAFASPVRGEVFRLTCSEIERGGTEVYLLDSFQKTAHVEALHIWEDGVISHWNERAIIWLFTHSGLDGAISHVFFRGSGVLQKVTIDRGGAEATTFRCQLT